MSESTKFNPDAIIELSQMNRIGIRGYQTAAGGRKSEVYWVKLISQVVALVLEEEETSGVATVDSLRDIVTVGWTVGQTRADILGREFTPWDDVTFALKLFCRWPFKPPLVGSSSQYLRSHRARNFRGYSSTWNVSLRSTFGVRREVLRLTHDELHQLLATAHVGEFITSDD